MRHSLWVKVENAALLLAAELLVAVLEPPVPSWDRFSMGDKWKGRDTGTRPPSIPNPRGREEAEPSRLPLPVVETWTEKQPGRCSVRETRIGVRVKLAHGWVNIS